MAAVFSAMTRGCESTPAPAHLWYNVRYGRSWPWRAVTRAMRSAVQAGASRDSVLAFAEEVRGYALALFPVRHEPGLVPALLAEAEADGAADPVQAEALVHQDRVTLERVIETAQVQIDRLQVVVRAARLQLTAALRPRIGLVRGLVCGIALPALAVVGACDDPVSSRTPDLPDEPVWPIAWADSVCRASGRALTWRPDGGLHLKLCVTVPLRPVGSGRAG